MIIVIIIIKQCMFFHDHIFIQEILGKKCSFHTIKCVCDGVCFRKLWVIVLKYHVCRLCAVTVVVPSRIKAEKRDSKIYLNIMQNYRI